LAEFNERPLRDANNYFDIEMYEYKGSARLRFVPRDSAGEDERAVTGTRSRFQRALQTVDPSQYFIRFFVWTDSFDIYITTRRIVSDAGLLAGWEPQGNGWAFTTHLGGDFRLGPKPPEPKPKPGPPKPTRPANVID
jgi:hypothetical protein